MLTEQHDKCLFKCRSKRKWLAFWGSGEFMLFWTHFPSSDRKQIIITIIQSEDAIPISALIEWKNNKNIIKKNEVDLSHNVPIFSLGEDAEKLKCFSLTLLCLLANSVLGRDCLVLPMPWEVPREAPGCSCSGDMESANWFVFIYSWRWGITISYILPEGVTAFSLSLSLSLFHLCKWK